MGFAAVMLASWDKCRWTSLHPQDFQIVLVYSKNGFTAFMGPCWVFFSGPHPSFAMHVEVLPSPQSAPAWETRTSACPQLPAPCAAHKHQLSSTSCFPTASSSHCWSVLLPIYLGHSAVFMSQTPAAPLVITHYLVGEYLFWGRSFSEVRCKR